MATRILNIGMIDSDLLDNGTRHPNLAQMKMSSYCKKRGHAVKLLFGENDFDSFDLIIISKVFTYTVLPNTIQEKLSYYSDLSIINTSIVTEVSNLEKSTNEEKTIISIGGTGFFDDGGRNLDYVIEHIMPDYHLYDEYIDYKEKNGWNRNNFEDYEKYSIGFTSRGCFRKCSFCVNKKYDNAFKHAHVSEFLDKSRPMIYLWDDNIFALDDGWKEVFEELKETGKPFQFRQGLDIRLMTDERAKMLSSCKYHGDYIFAFDHVQDRLIIAEKLKLWRKFCTKTTKLYVLCAYTPIKKMESWSLSHLNNSKEYNNKTRESFELQDVIDTFERIEILMKYGCTPYIMRYESYLQSHFKNIYIQLARWCNQPEFYKKKSFREYCIANQECTKTVGRKCAPFKAMINFENKYPEIAKKYFDLKYETINDYGTIFGYGRTTNPCPICIDNNITWNNVVNKTVNRTRFLEEYYKRKIDTLCLSKSKKCCTVNIDLASQRLIDAVLDCSYEELVEIIDNNEPIILESNTIPQPGNLENGTTKLLDLFVEKDELTYEEIGISLLGPGKKDEAYRKYGESYSKFAALLDLVILNDKRPITVTISPVGKRVINLDSNSQKEFYIKQVMRIPIIQNLIRGSKYNPIKIEDYLKTVVNGPTVSRRLTAVKFILSLLKNVDNAINDRLDNIIDF
ncbi:MAG: hypothetical protein PHX08_15565 [Lachnospiraceae bacterium]|nr:hypothetical protein [Lachnospiraceae bacterium]